MFGEWAVYRTKPVGKTYGFCVPMFVHNWDYHFTELGVYSDGLFDCWASLDRSLFLEKVRQNWALAFPPAGAQFSVFNCGYGTVTEADWTSAPDDLVARADALLRRLNLTGENVLDLQGDETELRGTVRWAKLSLPNAVAFYTNGFGEEVPGKPLPVFVLHGDEWYLTHWFVFADGTMRVGNSGEPLTQPAVQSHFDEGLLATGAPPGAWIYLEGLGRFRSDNAMWHVQASERWKEALDEIALLNGSPGTRTVCMEKLAAYEAAPSDKTKEALRAAYRAVPEHLRLFCGDMDAKDGPIQDILYGTEGDGSADKA